MKSEIIWTQEHHYRDMVTLADAQAEIEKRDILLQKQGIQATKMKLLVDKQQVYIDRLLSHIREGFEEGDEKAQKEYEGKAIAILQEYEHRGSDG